MCHYYMKQKWKKICDIVIAVIAEDKRKKIARICKRDNISEELAKKKIRNTK